MSRLGLVLGSVSATVLLLGVTCRPQPFPGCGNGVILPAAGETCDDGNRVAGDGCSARCEIEIGWTCRGEPSECWKTPTLAGFVAGVGDLAYVDAKTGREICEWWTRRGETCPPSYKIGCCYGFAASRQFGLTIIESCEEGCE